MKMTIQIISVILLVTLMLPVHGVIYVGVVNAADNAGCGAPASPCATVSFAITQTQTSDTIILQDSLTYTFPSGSSWLPSNSLSGKTLIISGATKGNVKVGGIAGNTVSLLDWTWSNTWTAASITITQIIFAGGNPGSNGLVHLGGSGGSFGSLTFQDCRFDGFSVNSNSAAVLTVDTQADAQVTIQDCVFSNNKAQAPTSQPGGAIQWGPVASTSSLYISGPTKQSSFTTNSALQGGAVRLQGVWGQTVRIEDTTFDSNIADQAGGAISTISSLTSSTNNALNIYGCAFTNNVQGSATTTDANNLGGGAIAISQGTVSISGGINHICTFSGNMFGKAASTALSTRGGTAIRVTSLPADGDNAPLNGFSITSCFFSSNSGATQFAAGAPVFFVGSTAEVNAMAVKPTFNKAAFLSNAAVGSTASGLHYSVPDTGATESSSGVVTGCAFTSASPQYDLLADGGVQLSSTNGDNTVGRITLNDQASLFVITGAGVTINPPSAAHAIRLGLTGPASLTNAGNITFTGPTDVVGGSTTSPSTWTNQGTLTITKPVNFASSVRLTLAPSSTLSFMATGDTDYGYLNTTGPLTYGGALSVAPNQGYSPTSSITFPIIIATSASGTFSSQSCGYGSCSYDTSGSGVKVVVGPRSSSTSSVNVGAIVGGVIGGVVFVALVVLIAVLIYRHKKNQPPKNVDLPNPAFELTASGDPNTSATMNRFSTTQDSALSP